MRVLVWATHLQTDILAVACHLDRCPDVELLIVLRNREAFIRTPFARARPFAAPLLDRDDPATWPQVRAFQADVAVADNHVPPHGSAPRLFYMWHGMGWKARGRVDLDVFYHQVRHMIGADPRTPTPNFLAQCYGPTDLGWRVQNWKLPSAVCIPVGMAFSDLVLDPPYAKRDFAAEYKIDILGRKTVLLAITWHYGGIFAQSPGLRRTFDGLTGRTQVATKDVEFLRAIVESVRRMDANLLICLHDRQRYDPCFLDCVEEFASRFDCVEIRFKNEHPDNLTDLLAADVMISNLSSFLSYFYLLRRPAVHLRPATPSAARVERMAMLFSRFRLRYAVSVEEAWMLDPSDTGGPLVTTLEETLSAMKEGLDAPEGGIAATGGWLQRHVPDIDGLACVRIEHCLRKLCASPGRSAGERGSAILSPLVNRSARELDYDFPEGV